MKKLVRISASLLFATSLGAMNDSCTYNVACLEGITADTFLKKLSEVYSSGGLPAVKMALYLVKEQGIHNVLNFDDVDQQLPLEFAIENNDISLFEIFLREGADAKRKTGIGRSIEECVVLKDKKYSEAIQREQHRRKVMLYILYRVTGADKKENIVKQLVELDKENSNPQLVSEFLKEYYGEMIDNAQKVGDLCNSIGEMTLKGYPLQSQESILRIEEQLKEVQGQKSALENEKKQLNDQIGQVKSNSESLVTMLETANTEKKQVSQKQVELLVAMKEKEESLEKLKNELQEKQNLITKLEKEKSELETSNNDKKSELETLKQNKITLEKEKKTLQEAIDSKEIAYVELLAKFTQQSKNGNSSHNNLSVTTNIMCVITGAAVTGAVVYLWQKYGSNVNELTQ